MASRRFLMLLAAVSVILQAGSSVIAEADDHYSGFETTTEEDLPGEDLSAYFNELVVNQDEYDDGIPDTSDNDTINDLGRQNKLITNDDTFTTSLLMDIRDILYRDKEQSSPSETMTQQLEDLSESTKDALEGMASSVTRLRENTDQKVSIVLETFSTLKLLVLSQGEQLKALSQRLGAVEDETTSFHTEMRSLRRSVEEVELAVRERKAQADVYAYFGSNHLDDAPPEPPANLTDLDERIGTTSHSLDQLTSKMQFISSAVDTIRDELQKVQLNATDLEVAPQAWGEVSETTPVPAACECDTAELEVSVASLREDQREQKESLQEITKKVEDLAGLHDSVRRVDGLVTAHGGRLRETEEMLQGMTTVKKDVVAVQSSLQHLKEEMMDSKRTVITGNGTVSVSMNKLCVWPYKRGGDGCFHVHTDTRLSWADARERCREMQGDLAAPRRYGLFRQFMIEQRLGRAYTYWLGASDAEEEGTWRWVDGRPVDMGSGMWASNQPNEGRAANCLAVKPAYRFVASDEECHAGRYFICQQEGT
ncbi:C-type lectin domain family 4 member M-like [Penaeus chinensis]|uniref:C-type lectin domain family 4 member M-like n=1 Tax=Penaeus chinensis TaxID=139456 RepID=UPI001FB7141B|nr:C-type lectin domain family 4 member M-like [Penaeus chinensis]